MARDITQLHPQLQEAVKRIKQEFPELGVGECVRTVEEQNALYAKGRTVPGSIVTNAKGSTYSSQHQWGIAVDFFYNQKGKEYSDKAWFEKVGTYAKSISLGWGGDWTSSVDMPHLYLPDWGDTPDLLKKKYGTPEAFGKTWEAVKKQKTQMYARGHVQNIGWQEWRAEGEVIGTAGKNLRLEALQMDLQGKKAAAKVHMQKTGWVEYPEVTKETVIGKVGESKRLECICLEGDFEYRVFIQDSGWTNWTKADGVATMGTVGQSLRIEAIQFRT